MRWSVALRGCDITGGFEAERSWSDHTSETSCDGSEGVSWSPVLFCFCQYVFLKIAVKYT